MDRAGKDKRGIQRKQGTRGVTRPEVKLPGFKSGSLGLSVFILEMRVVKDLPQGHYED